MFSVGTTKVGVGHAGCLELVSRACQISLYSLRHQWNGKDGVFAGAACLVLLSVRVFSNRHYSDGPYIINTRE